MTHFAIEQVLALVNGFDAVLSRNLGVGSGKESG